MAKKEQTNGKSGVGRVASGAAGDAPSPVTRHPSPEAKPPAMASGTATVWLKNVEAIGAVLGLKFYAPRQKKRLQQLEDLRDLTSVHDFPKKDVKKGYWPRQAVVEWLQTNVKLAGNKRSFALVECDGGRGTCDKGSTGLASPPDTRHTPLPAGDLPPQANAPSGGEDDLFGEEGGNDEKLLDLWEDKVTHPERWELNPIKGWEMTKLERRRPWLFAVVAKDVDGSPNITGGRRGVAGYILNNFKIQVSHQSIANWIIGDTLPAGCSENFPCSEGGGSNRWKKLEVDAWVNKWLKPAASQPGLPAAGIIGDRSRKEKADADVAEMEADLMRRQLSTKYLETVTVEGFIEGFGTWIGQQQDKFIEGTQGANCVRAIVRTVLETILQGSVTPEQLAIIDQRLVVDLAAGNDAMKVAAGHQAGDLLSQLKRERAEHVKVAQQE